MEKLITYGKKPKPIRKGERGTYIEPVKNEDKGVKATKATRTTKKEVVDNE